MNDEEYEQKYGFKISIFDEVFINMQRYYAKMIQQRRTFATEWYRIEKEKGERYD